MCTDAFWERSGFVVVENSEVKLARSGVIPGWVTSGKLAGRQLPKVKPLGVIPETDNILTARDRTVTQINQEQCKILTTLKLKE